MTELTWLHLSDWHQRGEEFDREVMRNALKRDIEKRTEFCSDLAKIDFIIFSGDVAFSGKANEYQAAKAKLFDPLLEAADLEPKDLFIVPGNHDLDRQVVESLPLELKKRPPISAKEVQDSLCDKETRSMILKPFQEFVNFIKSYTHQSQPGYGDIRIIPDKSIALLGLNTAWMSGRAGDDSEKGVVHVGEPQIEDPLNRTFDQDVKIAVLHHPFEWFAKEERELIEHRLIDKCDFILTGHEHRSRVLLNPNRNGFCAQISTGAGYGGRIPDDPLEINSYNFVHFDLETKVGVIFFRRWFQERTEWKADTVAFREGKFVFDLKEVTWQNQMILRQKGTRIEKIQEVSRVAESSEEDKLVGQFIRELYVPRIIINKLSEKITIDNILNAEWPGDVGDPIDPIRSLIIGSMEKHGEGTAVEGLVAIRDRVNRLFDTSSSLTDEQMKKIAYILFYHYSLIGKLAINRKDSYISSNVIEALNSIGCKAVEKKFRCIAYESIVTIEGLGENGAQEKFGNVVEFAIEAMMDIGRKSSKLGSEFEYATQWAATLLGRLAVKAIKNDLINEANHATEALGSIGSTSAGKELRFAAISSAGALENVAEECTNPTFSNIAIAAITYLRNIGLQAARNKISGAVGQIAESLVILVEKAAEQEQYERIPVIAWSLGFVGVESAGERELAESTHTVADRLDRVVKFVDELDQFNKRSEVISQASRDLGIIGQKAAENRISNVASRVAFAFGSVGPIAAKNNIDIHIIESYLDLILEAAEKTVETDISMGSALYHLGRTYNVLEFYPKAEKASRKATEIDHPQRILAWIQLQKSLLGQGKNIEAEKALQEYKKLKEKDN